MRRDSRQILVVGPAWVGDMVMAQSLYLGLKERDPLIEIDVLAPAWSLPLLERMPQVRRGVELPIAHGELKLPTRVRLGRDLRRQGYDQALVLPRSIKAALVPFFARIPRRTGYRGEMRYGLLNDVRLTDKKTLPQTGRRFVALGRAADAPLPERIPYPQLTVDEDNATRLLESLNLSLDRPVAGIMPGAEFGPSKQWPLEYYAEVVRRLTDGGYQVWIFGSSKDHPAGETIVGQAGAGANLCGKTRLVDTVDLFAKVDVAVTNDSGLMHVAAAVGCAVIVMYGATSPEFNPPLTERATVLFLDIVCSPCWDRTCRFGHYRCLRDITVERVLAAARRFG